jgi:peptidoglycan/xylan/chitin deacetylase (PgdA/CDA1 family)
LTIKEILKIISIYQQETGCGKKISQNMNLAQLKEVEASGLVTIGAHTLNHPILKNEDNQTSYTEITDSINKLEQLLGHPVKYFAYPNGRPGLDFGEREINYLKNKNISLAFSTELAHLSVSENRFSIPRMNYARMGLSPLNLLVAFRLYIGKYWIDIKSVLKPTEKKRRKMIMEILNPKR